MYEQVHIGDDIVSSWSLEIWGVGVPVEGLRERGVDTGDYSRDV